MISLPHLAITAALLQGCDAAMTEDTVLRVTLPIKISIDSLKKAEATVQQVFEALEFFTLAYGATDYAKKQTTAEAVELLDQRAQKVHLAAQISNSVLNRMKEGKPQTCTGLEIKALDEGFTAAIELHEALPEWAFMQAGYKLIKFGTQKRPTGKRKKRKKR